MKKPKGAIGYNKEWAVKVGKAEFIKQMDAHFPDRKEEHKTWADAHLTKKPETSSEK